MLYTCTIFLKDLKSKVVLSLAVETEGPGPGAYKTVDSFLNNDKPAFSFRKRLKDRAEAESK